MREVRHIKIGQIIRPGKDDIYRMVNYIVTDIYPYFVIAEPLTENAPYKRRSFNLGELVTLGYEPSVQGGRL